MAELTKQWLQQKIADMETARDEIPFGLDEDDSNTLAALRIALASLEAEAVGITDRSEIECLKRGEMANIMPPDYKGVDAGDEVYVYTAPPAPVALTSGYSDFEEIWSSSTHPLTQDDEMKDFAWDIWNACRAAMLQGAEPVTTAYKLPFEQWLSQQTGTIDVECGCVMTEVFFHWLRVAYETGNSPVIPDGWVACSERMPDIGTEIFYFCQDDGLRDCGIVSSSNFSGKGDAELYVHAEGYDLRFGVDITHWMPLPAAPQQEVK
ncbi:DUF551 domain-containing protein [Enterobacter soli]|nr:DUF551 domain-containing protein [Enterobacter soli]